jgi:hypothetical protein
MMDSLLSVRTGCNLSRFLLGWCALASSNVNQWKTYIWIKMNLLTIQLVL